MNTKVAVVLKSKITHVNKQQMRERKKPREDERWIDYFTVVELLNIWVCVSLDKGKGQIKLMNHGSVIGHNKVFINRIEGETKTNESW